MKRVFRALVVDDHPVVGQATKTILEKIDEVEVIGVVRNGQQCLDMIAEQTPDIVFLDYLLPDIYGSHVAESIKRDYPDIHIVIFTGVDVADLYNHLIEIGVSGIISKEAGETTIINMVRAILDNHTVVPLSLFRQMRVTSHPVHDPLLTKVELTADEVQMMTMLVKGATHEQIAAEIHVSKRSVDNYLKKIYEKFGVRTKIQAIEKFVRTRYYLESDQREDS